VKETIIEEYKINPEKIECIPLPVYRLIDIQEKPKNHNSKMKIILMPAELRIRKGIRYAIETMKILKKKVPEAVLLICGKTSKFEKEYIQQLLREAKGKANIITAGFLPRDQFYKYIKSAECAFLPVLFEGQSEALSECIANGLPVVTNDYNQYGEEVINQVGYCAKHRDIEDYANGLIKLLKDNSFNQEKRQNTKIIAEQFSLENFKKRINEIIREF
ncbi:glycosyltransferase family 4 protein, partial [Candidatus Woesearchaeota archaeon]|nr:glycosyltransferase family 4 protein [Candidatus Woesearchaeota archaeon]